MDHDQSLREAILSGDRLAARHLAKAEIQAGADPTSLLNDVMIPAMKELGEEFSRNELLLPDLLVGARAMRAALEVIEPLIENTGVRKKGTVCIGSIKGDNHDIGKNIVAMMLRAAGYEVIDLGVNCEVERYREGVKEGAEVVLCSCLSVQAAPNLREAVDFFKGEKGVPVVVGGAGVTRAFAEEIGAHAYGADAGEAVDIVERLLSGE